MFVRQNKTTSVAVAYPSTTGVFDWVDETAPEGSYTEKAVGFIVKLKKYKLVEHNFQQDINSEIVITPEKVVNNGIDVNFKNPVTPASYTKTTGLNKLNASDVSEINSTIVKNKINSDAQKLANDDIVRLQNEIKQKQQKLNDLQQTTNKEVNK